MVTTICCPKCGALNEEGVNFCIECDTFLPWTDAAVRPRHEAGIELGLSTTHLDVAPGGEASVEVHIRNTGRNVDRVDLDIEGVADGWTVVEPGTVSLLPGLGSVARLIVRPPRDATVPAGRHLLELRGRSSIDATVVAEQRVSVDVAPFDDLRVRMTPPTSRGTTRGLHRVVVENAGNHPVTVSLHGRDRDGAGEVAVDVQPSVLELEGGAHAASIVTVSPVRPLGDGSARPLPFVVVAQTGPTETALDGVMIQEPEPAPAPLREPPTTGPPTTVAAVQPAPRRRRRWWPRLLAALALVGGLGGAALAVVPVDELRDRLGAGDDAPADVVDVADGVADDGGAVDADGGETPPPPGDGADAGALPDLTVTAVQCALVPDDGELRFAVQVANQGAVRGDPVTVRATAGDLTGSADVTVDGLATAVFGVPVDGGVLGSELSFTIAIDPDEAVEEADEGNNAGIITITLPAAANQPVSLCG